MIPTIIRRCYHSIRYGMLANAYRGWINVFCYKPIKLSTMDYDEYWDDDRSKGFENDSRVRTFLRLIEPGASVVEIGCGDGTLLALLKKRLGAQVKGYDVSTRAVEKARAMGVAAEVRDASVIGLDEGADIDFIVIADCLEHLAVPESLLQRLRGRFQKAILISVPNSCYWRYRFRVLFGSFMVQWVAHPAEHLRFWSIADMRWWLGQNAFVSCQTYSTWGIPLLKYLWPSMFAQNVIYVVTENCRTVPGRQIPNSDGRKEGIPGRRSRAYDGTVRVHETPTR